MRIISVRFADADLHSKRPFRFEQKPIPLPETQDEATDQPDGDAIKDKKPVSLRALLPISIALHC
jgi:hypothetical protein